jgi:hypothetical protein
MGPPQPRRSWMRDGASPAVVLVSYAVGDYVVPTDLPRHFLCRVTQSHPVDRTPLQVLELQPFDGPWPRGTRLVRGSDWVRPAIASEVAGLRRRRSRETLPRRRRWTVAHGHPGAMRLLPNSTHRSSSTPTGTPIR